MSAGCVLEHIFCYVIEVAEGGNAGLQEALHAPRDASGSHGDEVVADFERVVLLVVVEEHNAPALGDVDLMRDSERPHDNGRAAHDVHLLHVDDREELLEHGGA